MKCRWASVGLLLLGAAFVIAQESALAWSGKVGDSHTYSLHMEFSIFGDMAVYTSKVTEKTIEVGDGKFVIETTQSDYKVSVFGDEQAVSDTNMPKAQVVYAMNGDVVECRGELVNDAVYRMANLTAIRRPDKPVKVGDTWTREIKGDPKTGTLAAKATYKVEGEEKIKEMDAIIVSFDYAETEGADPAKSVGKVWFAKSGGTVLKVDSSWTSAPVPGAPTPIIGTYTLELDK